MDRKMVDEVLTSALSKVKGLRNSCALRDEHRLLILAKEQEAEERSLMGLGKVINTGVREILQSERIYVALTNMDFDWGCNATLVLKKGDEVVGEEVRDEAVIAELSTRKNVWFLHKNFVVYKDKISFPRDIMQNICHFEIPCLPAHFCFVDNRQLHCHSILYANPSTLCDLFLKEHYFKGRDEKGLGTILVGVKL
ncbi:MAG: hypothetical protein JSW39_15985 [Desulfobacterales bacterium]|nr:MAG: hypothetical protein JSW39_15985 [Desulfobacterales bacterium]